MKRPRVGWILVGLVALAVGAFVVVGIVEYNRFNYAYSRIKIGMTVDEVEAMLGPGREVDKSRVPQTRYGPVVRGDVFHTWTDEDTAREIWIGVVDGKVREKWWWEPSF